MPRPREFGHAIRRHPALPSNALGRAAAAAALAGVLIFGSGCQVVALAGIMADTAKRTGDVEVPADYTGLTGKSYAVVVSADRVIQSEHAGIVAHLTDRINTTLAAEAGASAHIPTASLLRVLYNKPQWAAMSRHDVAEMLGVERLVVVDLTEFRLTEPGNRYLWDGAATAYVEVYESDGPAPEEPMYERSIRVGFPDHGGVLREELPESAVSSALSKRLTDRVAWLFYDHKEPYTIEY